MNSYAKNYCSTARGKAVRAWAMMKARVTGKNGYAKYCRGTKLLMSRDEFLAWAVPQYEAFMCDHPDETPSVDRINPDGHYELANLRIISFHENRQRARHYKNRFAPEGQLWCATCEVYLPIDSFPKSKYSKTGRSNYCRKCSQQNNEQALLRRVLTYNGQSLTIAEWSQLTGITPYAIQMRLRAKWNIARVLTQPHQAKQSRK